MIYRRRASPLHAARGAVGALWVRAVAAVALAVAHPLVLAVLLAAVVAAAALAGVLAPVARVTAWGVPFALVVALINPLVYHEGLTVIARLGTVPVLGQIDVTLEATAFGGVLALRALILIAAFALYSTAVDPDDLLHALRRLSFRGALSAALATRMVPVLARDAQRMAEAQRCLPGAPAPRLALVRAVSAGALDRAVDVAATLELRGYGGGRRAPRRPRPWSRHDLAFAASALAIVVLLVLGELSGAWAFDWNPRLHSAPLAEVLPLAIALAAVALAPFADRRGVAR